MNIKEYISSGIVESYVLGLATEQECAEFERMCASHSEVKLARDAFEVLLEKQMLSDAVAPPQHIRNRVLGAIETAKGKTDDFANKQNGRAADTTAAENTPVIKMYGWLRYFAAASIILLMGSTVLNFYFFSKYKSFSAQYDRLVEENRVFAKNTELLQTSNKEYLAAIDKLRDPAMAIIKMEGNAVATSPDPSSMATVYWDTRTKDVYLFVNKMPHPADDKQYQLWAIVDGVPVDAGVFTIENGLPVVTMKNIPKAQAFAITLEKKGGSPKPEGQMYVLGKVS